MNPTLKRFSMFKDIIMFICLIGLMITPYIMRGNGNMLVFGDGSPGDLQLHLITFHFIFGVVLTLLFVIHIGINFKWLTGTAKAWGKANAATKAKFWMMIIVCLFMGTSIVTGILWGLGHPRITDLGLTQVEGLLGATPSTALGTWHTITSWAAFYFTGIHIGLHLQKFLSFFAKPKAKPAAPAAKPAA